jgi:hypothetical protein
MCLIVGLIQGCREKKHFIHGGGSTDYYSIMENNMEVPQDIKNTSRSDPRGYISKGNEIIISKGYLCSHVYFSIIHSSQGIERN